MVFARQALGCVSVRWLPPTLDGFQQTQVGSQPNAPSVPCISPLQTSPTQRVAADLKQALDGCDDGL